MKTFSALVAYCGGIYRWRMNSPHKGRWRVTLMFSLICARTSGWVNNRDAGDFGRHHAHYEVTVMIISTSLASYGVSIVNILGESRSWCNGIVLYFLVYLFRTHTRDYQIYINKHTVITGLILGLHPANERRGYLITTSLTGWAQA